MVEPGAVVVAEGTVGRVAELPSDTTVALDTLHGSAIVERSAIVRLAVARERAAAILDRLAVPGAPDAMLPAGSEGRRLLGEILANRGGPESDAADEVFAALRRQFNTWVRAQAVEALVDDIRTALAIRLEVDDPRVWSVMYVLEHARLLFEELALVTGRPLLAIELGVARAHSAPPPLELMGHVYLGHFETRGALVSCDFCYLNNSNKLMRAEIDATPGRFHAWVSWSPTGQTFGLVVTHESALSRITEPTRKVATVFNDAGMIGVFDAAAADDRMFRGWLTTQAECGAAVHGITDERGVVVNTEGDGSWDVRVAVVDKRAVMIRIGLTHGATGKEPIVVTSIPSAIGTTRAYSANDTFSVDDTITHPVFGSGRVMAATHDRIDVAFPAGAKKLVHGRKQ